jgi:hypothetical protein
MPIPHHQDQKHSQPARQAAHRGPRKQQPSDERAGYAAHSEPCYDGPFQLLAVEPNATGIPDQLRDREDRDRLASSKGQHQHRQQNRRPTKSGDRRQGGSEESKDRQQGKMNEVRHSGLKKNYHVAATPATTCESSNSPFSRFAFQ